VADYPFTTLEPNLGVVQLSDFRTFVVADIPGIIEGAHEGKGLGHKFLRHIERTRTLALVIAVDAPDVQAEYEALRSELEAYSSEFVITPHCVMLSKTDLLPPDEPLPELDAPDAWGIFGVSSVAHRGLDELLPLLWEASRKAGVAETPDADDGWWSP